MLISEVSDTATIVQSNFENVLGILVPTADCGYVYQYTLEH